MPSSYRVTCEEQLCPACGSNKVTHGELGGYFCHGCTLQLSYSDLIKNEYYLVPDEQLLNFWDKLIGRKVKYKWKRVEKNG